MSTFIPSLLSKIIPSVTFSAFGRRDIRAALETFDEKVDFQSPVTRNAPPEISWAKPRYSREEVGVFFRELLERVTPETLEIIAFTADGDRIVVEGWNRGTVKSTGHTYEHDWVMVFTVRGGKITRYRHYYDTADLVAAFGKE